VLQAFPGSFPAGVRPETVGNPVRLDIAAIDDPASRFANRAGAIRLLVLGGSQGALALNRTVPQSLALLSTAARPIVRHQAGKLTLQTAIDAYADAELEADVTPFIEDMAEAYAWADIVVCRAGALTVAEIAAAGLAAVFVPFPAAVDDHQTENARPLVEAGAAVIMREQDLTPQRLADCLADLLSSREILKERAVKSRALAQPDALGRITDVCLQAAGALT
jgi:UDP-N-acetylglucosamine--N-acetylmuramyl-(pentapeptide) pyrophosphoryl-undecaprenol N-acetylglucosamine transferase